MINFILGDTNQKYKFKPCQVNALIGWQENQEATKPENIGEIVKLTR
jgi:hypothetical protein